MTLNLPKLYTLDQIASAIDEAAGGEGLVSRRTLEDVVRELGYNRGRGRKRLFTEQDARDIQEAVTCRATTHREPGKGTGTGSSGAGSRAGSTSRAFRRRETKRMRDASGEISEKPSSGKVTSLEIERSKRTPTP